MGIDNDDRIRRVDFAPDRAFLQAGRLALCATALLLGVVSVAPAAAQLVAPTADASPWSAPEPWRTDNLYLQTSIWTKHFRPSPDHNNNQNLINVEWRFDRFWASGQWVAGAGFFRNSFGQPTEYYYGGWLARPFDEVQPLYFKITAGALHGYAGAYQNKIPFNSSGVAPAILPSVGYCYIRVCSELILFGSSGVMLTLGVTVP